MIEQILPLLTLDVPKAKKAATGFLEIINKQYHENINSSVYAHFINADEQIVNDLFMNALTELIAEKSDKHFTFGKAVATCEVATKKGRIDIVIEDHLSQNKIIIENKIFHWLHNDLLDYWNHFPIPEDLKVGILLTPYPYALPVEVSKIFINITHAEWIAKVKSTGLPFEISNKYSVYITDFINTIESLSKNIEMNEQVKFYFQHAPKILQVQETVGAANEYINNQINRVAEQLGWSVYGNNMVWRNIWDAKNDVQTYLTIILNRLMNGENKILLIIDLSKDDKKRVNELDEILKNDSSFKSMFRGKETSQYLHLGVKEYTLTENELANFSDFVLDKIRTDFSSPLIKIIKHFYPNIKSDGWEENFKPLK